MFDLDAYRRRIGVTGEATLMAVHRAHACSIPFENLDPHRGCPVLLDGDSLQRKLVTERRGGYCFEHNLLLKHALEALGATVELMLGRVVVGAPPDAERPRTHLLLRVHGEGAVWHADVGFGAGTLLDPIPFGPGEVHEQAGWRFQIVERGEELVLRSYERSEWTDLYRFLPHPVPHVDVETSNWFTSTHPRSPFVTGLLVATQRSDGTRTSLSDWEGLRLRRQSPIKEEITPIEREQVPPLLESVFGLPGFALDADGRVVRAACGPRT
jgi:N-hydroxyarylamine O-acetyltransferase